MKIFLVCSIEWIFNFLPHRNDGFKVKPPISMRLVSLTQKISRFTHLPNWSYKISKQLYREWWLSCRYSIRDRQIDVQYGGLHFHSQKKFKFTQSKNSSNHFVYHSNGHDAEFATIDVGASSLWVHIIGSCTANGTIDDVCIQRLAQRTFDVSFGITVSVKRGIAVQNNRPKFWVDVVWASRGGAFAKVDTTKIDIRSTGGGRLNRSGAGR